MNAAEFGAFIRQRRTDENLTQEQLAARLHVTAKAVSRWERGVGFPDIQTLEPLAKALGLSLLELMQCRQIHGEAVSAQDANDAVAGTLVLAGSRKGAWRSPWWWLFSIFLSGAAMFLIYLLYNYIGDLRLRLGGIGVLLVLCTVCSDSVHALVLRRLNPGMEPQHFGWRAALRAARDFLCLLLLLGSFPAREAYGHGVSNAMRMATWILLFARDIRRWYRAIMEED